MLQEWFSSNIKNAFLSISNFLTISSSKNFSDFNSECRLYNKEKENSGNKNSANKTDMHESIREKILDEKLKGWKNGSY